MQRKSRRRSRSRSRSVVRRLVGLSVIAGSCLAISGVGAASARSTTAVATREVAPAGLARPGISPDTSVAMGTNADGRLEVFAVDDDGALIHAWELAPGGPWSAWYWMGEFAGPTRNAAGVRLADENVTTHGRPAVGRNQDGRLEVFAVRPDGTVIHSWQLTRNGVWSPWYAMGISARQAPTVATAPDGRLETFAVAPDGAVLDAWQIAPNGIWSGWLPMDGPVAFHESRALVVMAPTIAVESDGRFHAYADAGGGIGLMHNWQHVPNGPWVGWYRLNVDFRTPSAGSGPDGRIETFAPSLFFGANPMLYQNWQMEPSGGLSPYVVTDLGTDGAPAVGVAPDGRLEIFAKAFDGDGLMHRWQLAPGGQWSDWHPMGVLVREAPAVAAMPDGRLVVVAVTTTGMAVRSEQVEPNGIWTGWSNLGATIGSGIQPPPAQHL